MIGTRNGLVWGLSLNFLFCAGFPKVIQIRLTLSGGGILQRNRAICASSPISNWSINRYSRTGGLGWISSSMLSLQFHQRLPRLKMNEFLANLLFYWLFQCYSLYLFMHVGICCQLVTCNFNNSSFSVSVTAPQLLRIIYSLIYMYICFVNQYFMNCRNIVCTLFIFQYTRVGVCEMSFTCELPNTRLNIIRWSHEVGPALKICYDLLAC